jgi:hypothetical protein
MTPEYEALLKIFREVTVEYITALQDVELARLDALLEHRAGADDTWLEAERAAEEINKQRQIIIAELLEAKRRLPR